ncbi:hypothetical protein [Pyrodictium abyssi]
MTVQHTGDPDSSAKHTSPKTSHAVATPGTPQTKINVTVPDSMQGTR